MNCELCRAPLETLGPLCPSCQTKSDPMVGRMLLGQYKITRKLGQGGFGAVYEAEQPSLARKVAIKVLHPDLSRSPDVITRFRREGLIATRLKHPSCVEVFNLGQTDDGYLWLAMEFVRGQTFESHLKKNQSITPQELSSILTPVCEILSEAHEKGIIHRDLKPDNIMLSEHDGQRVIKVLDFGISSLQGADSATHTAMVSGTPQYMAPEQWEGLDQVDARSDVYSLGIIMYRALSGCFPFEASSPMAWMKKHSLEAPLDLSIAMSGRPLSSSLSQLVMRAIAKDPSARQQSTRQLLEELSLAAGEETPSLSSSRGIRLSQIKCLHAEKTDQCFFGVTQTPKGELFAAGELGLILQITTAEEWEVVDCDAEDALFDIWSQPGVVCAAGAGGVLLCSADGERWERRAVKTKEALRSVWGVGERLFAVGDFGAALISEDLGRTFRPMKTGSSEHLRCVWGVSEGSATTIFITGSRGTLLRSLDMGASWQRIPLQTESFLSCIGGRSSRELRIVTTDGQLLSSQDGEVFSLARLCEASLRKVYCLSDRDVVLTNEGAYLSSERSGGWTEIALELPLMALIETPNGLVGVGKNNAIVAVSHRDELVSLRFSGTPPYLASGILDGDDVVVCGSSGLLYSSTDEGHTWVESPILERPFLSCVHRPVGGEYLFYVGLDGYVACTERSGRRWQFVLPRQDFFCVWSTSVDALYVIGDNGVILFTENDGTSWQSRDSGVRAALHSMWGDAHRLFIVGANGLILCSTDQGYTWEILESNTRETLYRVIGFETGELFAVGEKGTLLASTNHGRTWQKRVSTTRESLSNIQGSADELFICGAHGVLLCSTDRGWTWRACPTGVSSRLTSSVKVNDTLLVFGVRGLVLSFDASLAPEAQPLLNETLPLDTQRSPTTQG